MSEEKKTVISVNHVSKDYGQGRGNFDVTFRIKQGETLGIVGENGRKNNPYPSDYVFYQIGYGEYQHL